MEVVVTVTTTDLGHVVPAHHTRRIAFQSADVGNVQLPGEVGHDACRNLRGVGEESAQEPHRAQLHGEPEAVVIATASGDEAAIGVVEVEVAIEQSGRRLARVAAVAPLLILSQEVDRHPGAFLKQSVRLDSACQIGSSAFGAYGHCEFIGFPEPILCDKMGIR